MEAPACLLAKCDCGLNRVYRVEMVQNAQAPGGLFRWFDAHLCLTGVLSAFLVSYYVWDSTVPGSCSFGTGVVVSQANAAV